VRNVLSRGVRKGTGKTFVISARLTPASLFLLTCMATGLLVGCKVGPDYKTPAAPLQEQWRMTASQVVGGQPADPREWWRTFNDPVLDSLVDEAFAQNMALQTVAFRIIEGRLTRSLAMWMFGPVIIPRASAIHHDFSTNVKPEVSVNWPKFLPKPSGDLISVTPEVDIYQAGFDAFWEMDIWGKLRRNLESADAELTADIASYDDILVTLVGEVAATYIQIRTVEQRIVALRRIMDLDRKFLALTEERVGNGQVLETDLLLAKALLGMAEQGLPRLEGARDQLENALCILLGRPAGDLRGQLGGAGRIPMAPAKIAVGIPADLLRRRPDVRLAEARAHAECAQIGKAKAMALYPSLSLFGSLGLRSSATGDFFDSDSQFSSYGALSHWGIFLYPGTVQIVRARDVDFEQAVLQYKHTVLRAGMEVENAISSLDTAQKSLGITTDTVAVAQKAADSAMAAYKDGKVIVSLPLEALKILASQEDQMLGEQGACSLAMVAVYKGIGGGWELREGKELIPQEVQKRMKDRTDWWFLRGGKFLETRDLPSPPLAIPIGMKE
jgi:NodT family efflux transporter outer membrane factor (OMF) lipoprotein